MACCLLAAFSAAVWYAARFYETKHWNVVIVTFDTTRADRIGYHGYDRARTPTLDALSRDGVAYLQCYTPAPVTLPAHCSLMTGLTPLRHGVHDNGLDALAADVETLAEVLGRHGYATAAFVGAFVLDHQFGLAQGFQHYDDDMSEGKEADQFCYAERNARLVTDAALQWLSQQRSRPACVWIHYFDPHSPYEAPGFDPTFSSLTAYDAEINFADSQLKRLIEFFDKADRPTLFVVAADHGEGLGDHGEPTHGMFAYNSTLHVPLVVRFPHSDHAAARVDTPVSLVDVMPSVLNWLGLPANPDLDGRILPLRDNASHLARGGERGIYFENYFVSNNYGWSPLVGAIWNDLKFIQAPRPELYDLTNDPEERAQIDGEQSREIEKFQTRFEALLADLRARGSFAAQAVDLTTHDVTTLESLGYAGSRDEASATEPVGVTAPDPKDMVQVLAKLHSATIAMERGRRREAVDALTEVVGDDPGNPRAVRMLAALIVETPEERPQILAALHETRRRARRAFDIDSLAVLGVGLFVDQRYEDSIEVLDEVVRRAPRHAAAYRYLGDAHRQLNHLAEAGRNYRQAILLAEQLEQTPDWLEHVRQQLDAMNK
jgi:arylsulfatase A-like enzyme